MLMLKFWAAYANSYLIYDSLFLSILQADGFEAAERVAIAAAHRQLLKDNSVFKYIQKWLGVEQKVSKHSKTSRVADIPSSMHVNV